ncbi:hypothetical protein [Kitasatospora sp. DSM 101779]|uniref:hypothetical protein n=1 Tax=Kitasatospora sp. DSM 101779 TaxID=2853165 RepID=UPI0021D82DA1|nr:hypothetical protein [Kitasatospora sp. DSM 101779]MCU7820446.1 hypothetical protein [Kitasatospora sp. DSM 101779]
MPGSPVTSGTAVGATRRLGSTRAGSTRALRTVLAAAGASPCVLTPVLQGSAAPAARADLGIGPTADVGDWTHQLADDIAVIALTRPAAEHAPTAA